MENSMPSNMPGTWKNRRKVIFGSLLYSAGALTFLMGWGEDTRLNQDIATGLLLLDAAVIGSDVFGAVWDDSRKFGNSISEHKG
mgnify:CR=1 FL=1